MNHSPPVQDLRAFESAIRRALGSGNQTAALEAAMRGADAARQIGDERAEWQFHFSAAEALHALDRYRELLELARRLGRSTLSGRDNVLHARALTMEATAQRCQGRTGPALSAAQKALQLLKPTPDHAPTRAKAYQTLIAALVEGERVNEAWSHHHELAALLDLELDDQTAGKGFWTLGNLAFVVREADVGLDYHARASRLLSPTNDIQLWARFNRASADLQLQAGIAVDQTRDCIDRALMAHEVTQPTEMDRIGLAETRARWGLAVGQLAEADVVLADATATLEDPNAAYLVPAYRLWALILDEVRPGAASEKRAEANRIEGLAAGNVG